MRDLNSKQFQFNQACSRADASSARRRAPQVRGPAAPPAPTRPVGQGQAAHPSPRLSVLSWPAAVPLNLHSPMSLPRHARAASCPTPRLPDESRTCPPAFMSIPSCPSPSTIRSLRQSPRQPWQARARPLPRISPGPPRAGSRAPRPGRRARALTLRRPFRMLSNRIALSCSMHTYNLRGHQGFGHEVLRCKKK
jgi:hypothetical protein